MKFPLTAITFSFSVVPLCFCHYIRMSCSTVRVLNVQEREKYAVLQYCAGLQNQGRLTRHRAALSLNPVFWFQIAFLHLIFTSKMTNMNTEVGI